MSASWVGLRSADGRWWWDGQQWLPVAPPSRPQEVPRQPTPDAEVPAPQSLAPELDGAEPPEDASAAEGPDIPTPAAEPEDLEAATRAPDVLPEAPADPLPRPEPARANGGMSTLFARVSDQLTPRKGEAATVRRQQLEARARRPVAQSRTIAVLSRKGGIGKTTTTVMLGHQLAGLREDRVVAIDGNPDGGTLADRVRREHGGTMSHLLAAPSLASAADLRRYVSQAPSRLDVLASDADPAVNHGRTADDYRHLLDLLAEHYALVLCDTGTGVLDTASQAILDRADQLVVCASPAIDAARIADATLDWLEQHGYERLAAGAVVVINGVSARPGPELGKLRMHFRRRCRAVVLVPWDRHLGTGLETSLDDLQADTRDAYRELAAEVADGLVPGQAAPAPRAIVAQPAPESDDGTRRLESPEGVNMGWRGEAARVRLDPATGRMYVVELPRLVTGGVLADGGRALVHLTSQQDCRIWFVRVPPSPEMPIQVDVVLEAPGLVSDGRGPHGRPVYVLTGSAGPHPARTLLEAGTAHVYGLDLPADVSSQPAPRPAESVVIPGLVHGGLNLAGRPVSVLETRLHLVLATVVTDEAGMPLALDVPGYPEAEDLRF